MYQKLKEKRGLQSDMAEEMAITPILLLSVSKIADLCINASGNERHPNLGPKRNEFGFPAGRFDMPRPL